jgi:hypothetical protein
MELIRIRARKKGDGAWKWIGPRGFLVSQKANALALDAERARAHVEHLRKYETAYEFRTIPSIGDTK